MVHESIKPPLVALYRGYKEIDRRRQRFRRWRTGRPFWGGIFLLIGGVVAGYTPFIVLTGWLFRSGSAQIIGILGSFFATVMVLAGVGALVSPEVSNLLGMVGITFSILSTLVGNFGGLLIGTFFGIVGGALCIAWRRLDVQPSAPGSVAAGTGGSAESDIDELRQKAERYDEMVEDDAGDGDQLDAAERAAREARREDAADDVEE